MPPLMARGNRRWLLVVRRFRQGKGWTTAAAQKNPARAGPEGLKESIDHQKVNPVESERRDLETRPHYPQRGALPSCATPR